MAGVLASAATLCALALSAKAWSQRAPEALHALEIGMRALGGAFAGRFSGEPAALPPAPL